MKKILIIVTSVVVVSLIACNSNGSKEEKKETTTEEKKETTVDITKDPDYQPGLTVIGGSDCLTCHKLIGDERIQGPSYKEVAKKYADSSRATIIPHLAKKIIEGGMGVWGEIPMTPHPALTQEEAEAAVKYILLLKNK